MDAAPEPAVGALTASTVDEVTTLLKSESLKELIADVDKYLDVKKAFLADNDPEYDLIVRCNEMSVTINHHIADIHKFNRDLYQIRFPELESLVPHALDYARTVLKLGNDLASVPILNEILPAAHIITISMAASNTTGHDLSPDELKRVSDGCQAALDLEAMQSKVRGYVASRMAMYAPNLSALVGSEVASNLIGAAGGLFQLSNVPSTTLFALGKKRQILVGLSTATQLKRYGFVGECDIMQEVPVDLEKKTARMIANKAALMARLDLQNDSYRNGESGAKFRQDILDRIEKWQAPPPQRRVKVIQRPDINATKTRRGGQKLHRAKQKYHVTEMRKRANRVAFGKIQEEHGNSMKTMGMLDFEGSGVIRATASEEAGFKIKAKKWKKMGGGRNGGKTPGFATSVFAYDTVEGLALVDPNANKEKVAEESQSYFNSSSSFVNLKK
eukprot:TRINITY_DN8968_c0_g1_i1.p1 TRINITY_DN8968_c0_g1~~TRINITY_DN8968_c0_g1_i1.p1  ORF type:complete len:506 (+),score=135.36 TRINITY_DN8968_c0_g1_i1:186-1520(+)